jgi:crotonobetainyl-CoA:carnitine CoA-transferase CaiB-like acyl-CoA transferase
VASDKLWESFCRAISRPDLLNDPRYRSNPLRVQHRAELEPLLEEMFRGRTAADWMEVLARAGIPCSLVRNLREVVEDEHLQARDMLPEVEHPTAGRIRVTGAPVKLSQSHAGVRTAARRLGEDSAALLSELLGMDEQEVERLRQAGVIG